MEQLGNNIIHETLEHEQERNKRIVSTLYEAFGKKKNESTDYESLFVPYLEWWFHGPARHQQLNRLLTGSSPNDMSFPLVPLSLAAFDSTLVVAEGYDTARSVSWVHAWTLSQGIITQVREYCNTFLTVTRLSGARVDDVSTSTEIRSAKKCESVWKSKLCDESSVPGLVVAL